MFFIFIGLGIPSQIIFYMLLSLARVMMGMYKNKGVIPFIPKSYVVNGRCMDTGSPSSPHIIAVKV